MKNVTRYLMIPGLVVVSAVALSAGESLKVRVGSRISMAPADATVYVTLPSQSDNRTLIVSVESDSFFRSSSVQLDGEESAHLMMINFRQLPAGSYDIAAHVIGSNGRTKEVAHCELEVQ
jgi:hypothetical protein